MLSFGTYHVRLHVDKRVSCIGLVRSLETQIYTSCFHKYWCGWNFSREQL